MSERAGAYRRSFSGLVGAMLVLVLFVLGFVAFRAVNRADAARTIEPVDYVTSARYAADNAAFPVLAPVDLPEGWQATSVRFEGGKDGSWHLGVLTDGDRYVGLEQADRRTDEMVATYVGEDAEQTGERSVGGRTWAVFADVDDDVALVSESEDLVTLVVGRVPLETLTAYAASLAQPEVAPDAAAGGTD